jgi:Mn-dependent DtxR family transcriptional regulator
MRLSQIAKSLKITSPTAFNLVNRLAEKKLIEDHEGMIIATNAGMKKYKKIMATHRCFEILFTKSGIAPNEACRQARKFDYLLESKLTNKMLKYIGSPKLCPHGKSVIL